MSPKISFFLIICFLFYFSSNTPTAKATWVQSGFWYAGSEFPVPEINSALYTHLLFAFAYINSSSYELRIAHSDEPYVSTFTHIVTQKNPSLETILSIWAGREESPNFFSMLNHSSNRRSFIKTSIKAAREYGFHGLDLFGVIPNTDSNMATFMDEWRAAINSESETSGTPRLILRMGAYYSPVLDAMAYPVDSIVRNFDWIHLRSYDYYLPTKYKFTGAHAALYDPFSKLNTDYGIKEWINKRFPANKLTIGLPFHGYAWTLVNPKDNTVGSPAKGLAITADGSMSYKHIKIYNNSYKVTPIYNSTYVMNYITVESFWIGYDDVEAIKTKVSYAKEKGLLGYTVFQIPSDDDNWSLSRAAHGIEEDQHDKKKSKLAIVLPAGTLAAFLLCVAMYCVARKTIRSKGSRKLNQRSVDPNLQAFTFAQMQAATDNFSFQNKLGEGGFGPVYKGKLPNGQEIAVKRLSQSSKQGVEEFQNEVTLTVKLQHVNLLRIQGFCTEREEKMLIYDYMPNKSLDFYLYEPARQLQLDWEKRVQVIEGITQGLLYLQEYSAFTVIHRDLKASNILLDNEMKPKISDFGIAKIFQKEDNQANTGRIVGTYGCVPPEYVKGGVYSRKYDVYSFGVLLLQIISGKKNAYLYGTDKNLNLLEYAYEKWKTESGMEFMDPSLDDKLSSCKLIRCLQVGLLCVQEKWEDRPSMLEVDSMLKSETTLPAPKMPAFSRKFDYNEQGDVSRGEEDYCSVNVGTTSQLMPR
ncbi:PREDICTED: putative cysteine-rich receptor-like protein kinase 35 [Ipomoea nil]|uniref:putative cysteine-rich receptor-like protein kinase 35 n=1 Tax=Ipomoea nil TaxID=35883 RepID=UPI000901BD7F|nr:PREDICTED: putative cysteine-rich receptor-like protein kinase 35 [Ipomoea nil]